MDENDLELAQDVGRRASSARDPAECRSPIALADKRPSARCRATAVGTRSPPAQRCVPIAAASVAAHLLLVAFCVLVLSGSPKAPAQFQRDDPLENARAGRAVQRAKAGAADTKEGTATRRLKQRRRPLLKPSRCRDEASNDSPSRRPSRSAHEASGASRTGLQGHRQPIDAARSRNKRPRRTRDPHQAASAPKASRPNCRALRAGTSAEDMARLQKADLQAQASMPSARRAELQSQKPKPTRSRRLKLGHERPPPTRRKRSACFRSPSRPRPLPLPSATGEDPDHLRANGLHHRQQGASGWTIPTWPGVAFMSSSTSMRKWRSDAASSSITPAATRPSTDEEALSLDPPSRPVPAAT